MTISKKTRDLLAYIIGGTVVIIGTLLLVALATGWQYDLRTGELRETGLILMGSEPAGAAITVNDKKINQNTNYRYQNAAVGSFDIRYEKPNFRPWQARIDVRAGEVSFADYAWLIPNDVPIRQRYQDIALTNAVQSKDRRRIVFTEQQPAINGQTPAPRLYTSTDLSRPPVLLLDPKTVPTLAAANVVGYDNLQLSSDGSQLLLRLAFANSTNQWFAVSTSPSNSPALKNLTEDFIITPSWISWVSDSNNELTYVEKGNLRRLQLREQRISEALASNVVYANWSDDWLVFISQSAPNQTAELFIRPVDANDNRSVGKLNANSSYLAQYFRNVNGDYLAVLGSDEKTIRVFRNILQDSANLTSSIAARNATTFTVSPNGRYLVHNSSEQMVTIDFERYNRYRFATSLTGLTIWTWMNEQHLAMITNNEIRLVDFDGQNNQLLTEGVLAGSTLLVGENKSLLTFTKTAERNRNLTHIFLNPERVIP